MGAVGYIRQSRRADLDVALSRDAQLAAIRRLCDGCDILEDMGRSGKAGGERLRPGYQRLVAGIESGEYTEVYAIALSRFSRSVPELHALMELARNRGVRLVTAKEGTMDPHTATGRMIFNTWANFAEFVRDMAVEAANENVAVRRSRGDTMGRRPYGDRPGEDAALVVDAFREAGSYNGAATILNTAGIGSKLGRRWSGTTVRLVVARHAPTLAPRNPARGRRSVGDLPARRPAPVPLWRHPDGPDEPRGPVRAVSLPPGRRGRHARPQERRRARAPRVGPGGG